MCPLRCECCGPEVIRLSSYQDLIYHAPVQSLEQGPVGMLLHHSDCNCGTCLGSATFQCRKSDVLWKLQCWPMD
ncbi:hypothetical protein KP509_1Z259800 [Ceratopteris richardii]|nr:hypothetical protein KP509_1Z259800 [Ceratopteris richardii]